MAVTTSTRPRGPSLLVPLLLLLAFVAGLVLTAVAVMQWAPARTFLLGPAPVTAPMQQPVPAAPPPSLVATPGQVQVMDVRVADLEGRINRVDRRAAAAAGNAERAEGLLLAFAARRALDRGIGLGYLEGQLRTRFGDAQPRAVGQILGAAQQPVTIASLRQGLEEVGATLDTVRQGEDWRDALKRSLGNLFVVRRATTSSPAPDDRLRRARLLVEGGEVDGALAEVARLPRSEASERWMSAARRHIEAHRALDLIEATALTAPVAPALQPMDQAN